MKWKIVNAPKNGTMTHVRVDARMVLMLIAARNHKYGWMVNASAAVQLASK